MWHVGPSILQPVSYLGERVLIIKLARFTIFQLSGLNSVPSTSLRAEFYDQWKSHFNSRSIPLDPFEGF
jgi:hypothetical protein